MTLPPASLQSKPSEGSLQPSGSLLAQLGDELRRHPPFDEMDPAHVRAFVEASRQSYFAPGEALVQPEDGPAQELFFIRRGAVLGKRGLYAALGGRSSSPPAPTRRTRAAGSTARTSRGPWPS